MCQCQGLNNTIQEDSVVQHLSKDEQDMPSFGLVTNCVIFFLFSFSEILPEITKSLTLNYLNLIQAQSTLPRTSSLIVDHAYGTDPLSRSTCVDVTVSCDLFLKNGNIHEKSAKIAVEACVGFHRHLDLGSVNNKPCMTSGTYCHPRMSEHDKTSEIFSWTSHLRSEASQWLSWFTG